MISVTFGLSCMLVSRSAKSGGMTSVASARPLSSSRAASSGRAAHELHLGRVGEPLPEVEALVADVHDARQRLLADERHLGPLARVAHEHARRRARSAAGRRRGPPRAGASAPSTRASFASSSEIAVSAPPSTGGRAEKPAVLEREHAVGLERVVEEVRRDDGAGAAGARRADAAPTAPRACGGSSDAVGSSRSSTRGAPRNATRGSAAAGSRPRGGPTAGRRAAARTRRAALRPPRPGRRGASSRANSVEVLARREAPVLRGPLRRPADRGRRRGRTRPARRRRQRAREQREQRRLARAVRAEQDDDLARRDVEVGGLERDARAVAPRHAARRQRCAARTPSTSSPAP